MPELGRRYSDTNGPGAEGGYGKKGGAYHRETGAGRFDDRSDDYLKYNSRQSQSQNRNRKDNAPYDSFIDYVDYDEYDGKDGGNRRGGYDLYDDYDDYDDYVDYDDYTERGRESGGNRVVPGDRGQVPDRYPVRKPLKNTGERYPERRSPDRKKRSANKSFSQRDSRRRKLTVALAVMLCAIAAGAGILYAAVLRVSSPLNVSSALAQIEDGTVSVLLRSSVDDRLSTRSVNVNVHGTAYTFALSEGEFRLSDEPDGSVHKQTERVTVDGTEQEIRYTYMTKGSVCFNATKVLDYLHRISGSEAVRMVEPDYYVDIRQDRETKQYSGKLIIKAGSDGYGVDLDTFIDELLTRIYNDDYPPISSSLTTTHAPAVDIDAVYEDVHAKAKDAYTKNDGSGNISYEPEVVGIDFDKRSAAQKIAAGGAEWTIDLAVTMPKVTRKALMAETFPDLLATYSTKFAASNEARSSNLARAGEYINGTVLQPGDVFSFNGTVGERTPGRGFQKATVYSAEGTDEDYGGGICQTSSTLFYCAMKANLQPVERTNHRYTVGYMVDEKGNACYGNDATVNWGLADMKFRNTKEYPVKIECVTKTGVITFNIWGTWDGYTAEYTYTEKDIKDYQMVYRLTDPEKKDHAGQKGRTVTTYRHVFYQADPDTGEKEEIENTKEFVSLYYPMPKIMYVDTPPEGFEFNVLYDLSAQPSTTAATAATTAAPPPTETTAQPTETAAPTQPPTQPAQDETQPEG